MFCIPDNFWQECIAREKGPRSEDCTSLVFATDRGLKPHPDSECVGESVLLRLALLILSPTSASYVVLMWLSVRVQFPTPWSWVDLDVIDPFKLYNRSCLLHDDPFPARVLFRRFAVSQNSVTYPKSRWWKCPSLPKENLLFVDFVSCHE